MVRLLDRPDMTITIYCGSKTTSLYNCLSFAPAFRNLFKAAEIYPLFAKQMGGKNLWLYNQNFLKARNALPVG